VVFGGMTLLLLLTLRSLGPQYDLVELNHYRSVHSAHFDQLIFYTWDAQYRRHNVEHWVIVEDGHTPMRSGPRWVVVIKGQRVYAKLYRETWTTHDPERENKKVFDESLRRGLAPR
jgi:hypothetical protein